MKCRGCKQAINMEQSRNMVTGHAHEGETSYYWRTVAKSVQPPGPVVEAWHFGCRKKFEKLLK